jgi:hypothetical protein
MYYALKELASKIQDTTYHRTPSRWLEAGPASARVMKGQAKLAAGTGKACSMVGRESERARVRVRVRSSESERARERERVREV